MLLFLFLSQLTFAAGPNWPTGDIPRFWILGEGSTHFLTEGTFFTSKENYDKNGMVDQPAAMEHIRYGETKFHVGYGVSPRISMFAQADARGIFITNAKGSFVSDDDNYGFGDGFVGTRVLLFRSRTGKQIYPTEWAPNSWALLTEGTWLFPLYNRPRNGMPPLGNQSNDFTGMARAIWYASDWMALAASGGYTYRTAGYANEIPWNLRADILLQELNNLRLWVEFKATEALPITNNVYNPRQSNTIPGGSLFFVSEAPTLRSVNAGFGYLLSKTWELSLSGIFTATGINAAKGWGATLGFSYRPYQMPELRYEAYRANSQKKAAKEKVVLKQEKVMSYGFKATILNISVNGNFLKIAYGSNDGLKIGDTFQINEPNDLTLQESTPLGYAKIVAIRPTSSFLRVERLVDSGTKIIPGYEVQRVSLEP